MKANGFKEWTELFPINISIQTIDWDIFIYQLIKVAQRKCGGSITHRSQDWNLALIYNSVAGDNICIQIMNWDFFYISSNQSGAAEAWWAHNPQVPRLKLDYLYIIAYWTISCQCMHLINGLRLFIFIWTN